MPAVDRRAILIPPAAGTTAPAMEDAARDVVQVTGPISIRDGMACLCTTLMPTRAKQTAQLTKPTYSTLSSKQTLIMTESI
eukprot:1136632-Pelagomonas_calceolata.AAC.1